MSESTPRLPGEPHDPHQPPPHQPPPHGGQPPYGDEPYAGPAQPYEGRMPDPGLYPGSEYPPDRSVGGRPPVPGRSSEGGFFGALFDYSFTRYITPGVVRVVYVVVTVLVALAWLGGLVAAFAESPWAGIIYLLLAWIVALVYLALARITLEFFVAVISVAEKVNAYARRDDVG